MRDWLRDTENAIVKSVPLSGEGEERFGNFLPGRQRVVADFGDVVQVFLSSFTETESSSLTIEAYQSSPDVAPALTELAKEAAMLDVFTRFAHVHTLYTYKKCSPRLTAKSMPPPRQEVEPEPAGANTDRPVLVRLAQAALQTSYILNKRRAPLRQQSGSD